MDSETQKITAHLPKDLLEQAQSITGLGITETLKQGLERIKVQQAYQKVAALQGSLRESIHTITPLSELREDKKS